MKYIFGAAGLVVLVLFILTVGPFLFIWSVNTLFSLSIAFNFWNWLAAFILILMFGRGTTKQHA